MFNETITHAGGDTQGTANESHVLMLMRRALNRGYGMEATQEGGASIRWTRVDLTTHARVDRSIILAPALPIGALDDSTRVLLHLIGAGQARQVILNLDTRYIVAGGGTKIPQSAGARLHARQLISIDDKGRVRLTMAARLSLLAHDHIQTGGGLHGCFAMCSCGLTTSAPSGEAADDVMRGHRQRVTARFVESVSATYAAALTRSR